MLVKYSDIEITILLRVEKHQPPTDQKKLGIGPFHLVKAPKEDGGGLTWIGVPEKCDRCDNCYPMSWITITENGNRFICASCDYEESELLGSEYAQECDVCHNIVSMHEVTIEYNQLVCKKCSYDASKNGQKSFSEHQKKERGKYDHLFD